MNIKMRN